jgi:hypothetical protein
MMTGVYAFVERTRKPARPILSTRVFCFLSLSCHSRALPDDFLPPAEALSAAEGDLDFTFAKRRVSVLTRFRIILRLS